MWDLKDKKWAWAALATAAGILGLGNGVWSYLTEPLLVSISRKVVSLFSLGISSYKDGIYAAVARGLYGERVASELLQYLLLILIILPIVFLISFRLSVGELRRRRLGEQIEVPLLARADFRTPDRALPIARVIK